MITIDHLDHLVLTVADLERTCAFYSEVLGMEIETFGMGRLALKFGNQKFNLHQAGREFEPKAKAPTPGAIDLCLIVASSLDDVVQHLVLKGISIEEGPIQRTGAAGPITSIYIRDPDQNLIELSRYL